MIRIVVVHPERLYRESLVEAIRRQAGFEVLGHTGISKPAVEAAIAFAPEIFLVDISTPNGPPTVRALAESDRQAKVIATGLPDDDYTILAFAKAGVGGFLPENCGLEELAENILAAYRGELRCPRVTRTLLGAASNGTQREDRSVPFNGLLTTRYW